MALHLRDVWQTRRHWLRQLLGRWLEPARRYNRDNVDHRDAADGDLCGQRSKALVPADAADVARLAHPAADEVVEGPLQDHRHPRQGDAADGQHLCSHVPRPPHLRPPRHAALRRHLQPRFRVLGRAMPGGRVLRRPPGKASLPLGLLHAGDAHVLHHDGWQLGGHCGACLCGHGRHRDHLLRGRCHRRLLSHHEPLHRGAAQCLRPERRRRGGVKLSTKQTAHQGG